MRGPTVFVASLLGAGLVAACLAAAAAQAAPGDKASAAMTDAEGNEVGSVELTEMQNGTLLVAKLTGLPEGAHGFHVHTAGLCEPPRSEEHTSELQSLMRISYAVFCLQKKKIILLQHIV